MIDVGTLVRGKRNGTPAMAQVDKLAQLETEHAALSEELAHIAQLVAAPAETTVDDLTNALTRREALRLRLGALESLIAAERERMATEARQRAREEAQREDAAAESVYRSAVATLLDLRDVLKQAQTHTDRAASLRGERVANQRAAAAVRTVEKLLCGLQPERFQLTSGVDGVGISDRGV